MEPHWEFCARTEGSPYDLCRSGFTGCSASPTAGLGIDIWHDAAAPACSSKRSRSLPPSGRSVHRDWPPKCARSTVPACPVRILVRESDHPGGTELARRSPAPASKHAATHNHAPRGRVTGSQRTPNRQGVALGVTDWPRWCAPFRPLPPASGFDQGGQTLASQRPQTQSTVPACAWPHAGTFVATSGDLNWPCRELSRGHELLL